MNLPVKREPNYGLVPIRPSVTFPTNDKEDHSVEIDWGEIYREGIASLTASLPLGTAAWSVRADTQTFDEQKGDFWLGFDADGNPVGSRDDRHILLVGGNRSGKGISALVTNLLLWRGSMVVIDPKGENAMVTLSRRGRGSKYAEGLYQPTYLLDPYREVHYGDNDFSEYRACFNPLETLAPNGRETVSDAGRIADSLIETEKAQDPHWPESARTLMRDVILHLLTWKYFKAEQRNLVTVRRLLMAGDWEKRQQLMALAEDGKAPSGYELLFQAMERNPAFGGVVSDAGAHYRDQYKNAPRAFASVVAVAAKALDFLDDDQMRATLSRSDFRLSDLKTDARGVSLFISLPQRLMETHYGWLRMMTTLVTSEMEKVKGRPACGHPVLLMLDEFPALRRMRVIENAAAQIAGAGVRMVFVAQTLAQLKDLYKDNWETLVANAGAKLFFGNDDHFTREYVSKLIGETEVARVAKSTSRTKGRSATQSSSVSSGTSFNDSVGHSTGTSMGGRGSGMNDSFSQGNANGHSFSTSSSRTSGETDSVTKGKSQTIHKRALVTPDEVGRIFGDRSKRLGLLLMSGQQPMPVKRGFYYELKTFRGLFDPHRNFPPPPTLDRLNGIRAQEAAQEKRAEEERRERLRREREAEEAKRARAAHFNQDRVIATRKAWARWERAQARREKVWEWQDRLMRWLIVYPLGLGLLWGFMKIVRALFF